MGDYLIARLREVQAERRPLIRDVRGRGLWIGVDIEPALHASARDLVERWRRTACCPRKRTRR